MDEVKVERYKKEILLLVEDKVYGIVKDWVESLLNKFIGSYCV